MRRLAIIPVAGALGLAVLAGGGAAAQTCFTMQAELMHLQSRGGASTADDRARYERAYREQADVLARTETRARSAGCFGGGFFLFRRAVDPSCNMLIPKIRDMQDNLARLDHQRRRGSADASYRIQELQGMMNARGCDLPGGSYDNSPGGNFTYEPDGQTPYYSGNGTYRTLCVRTCDGYYFPISFSTTSEHFAEDAQSCTALCPGTEARLFYYANPGGGPENMTSITGEQYTSLPTAFRYRTSLDSACTCRPAGGYSAAASPPAQGVVEDRTALIPRARPAPGEDPETLADRLGYFVPSDPTVDASSAALTAAGPSGRQIRIVGPAYWGSNKEQDDLVIAPVPN